MRCSVTSKQLNDIVCRQISNIFWGGVKTPYISQECIDMALKRLEKCFEKNNSKYFWDGDIVAFKIEHSVQYSIFLYYLSNELYKDDNEEMASYVYYLNKVMHSVDWFYAIELPEHFGAEHPLSCILGRAKYGDYFFVYQGVTVGGNRKDGVLYYPVIGNNVVLYANATIIGNTYIGNNVVISANTYVKDEVIPDNCIVFGQSPNLIVKKKKEEDMLKMNHIWRF